MKYFTILLFLSACNAIHEPGLEAVDPLLQKYVDSFYHEARIHKASWNKQKHATVRFAALHGQAGLTHYDTHVIEIDSTSLLYKRNAEELVFHELGHLLLGRDHDPGMIGKYPKSIMFVSNGTDCWEHPEHWAYYVDELFKAETPAPEWSKYE